jgi:hypothetical protein
MREQSSNFALCARENLDHDDGHAWGRQQGGQDCTEERIAMQRTLQTHPENPSAF